VLAGLLRLLRLVSNLNFKNKCRDCKVFVDLDTKNASNCFGLCVVELHQYVKF